MLRHPPGVYVNQPSVVLLSAGWSALDACELLSVGVAALDLTIALPSASRFHVSISDMGMGGHLLSTWMRPRLAHWGIVGVCQARPRRPRARVGGSGRVTGVKRDRTPRAPA